MQVVLHHPFTEKQDDKFNSLFVRGLPTGTTDDKMKSIFNVFVSKDEQILSVKVQKDSEEKLTDYGYITFSNPKDAQDAVEKLNKTQSEQNRVFLLQKHLPKKEVKHQIPQQNSYVSNEMRRQNNNTVVLRFKCTPGDETNIGTVDELYFYIKAKKFKVMSVTKEIKKNNHNPNFHPGLVYIMMETQEDCQKFIQYYNQEHFKGYLVLVAPWIHPEERKREGEQIKMNEFSQTLKYMMNG